MPRLRGVIGHGAVPAGLVAVLLLSSTALAARPSAAAGTARATPGTADAEQLARSAPQAGVADSGARSCTGWTSTFAPPGTIRVLRTDRPGVPEDVVGSVEEVPFRDYVEIVVAAEWPTTYPREALRAGAVAVKQYAWYYTIVYRGGEVETPEGGKQCYDVVDTTQDQIYHPEERSPTEKQVAAIEATWDITLRKYRPADLSSRFFLTGYRSGASAVCGADANGWKLYARSVAACAQDGYSYREILRRYLEPRLEIVRPGRHDILGSRRGDGAALVRDDGGRAAHVWTLGAGPAAGTGETGLFIASDSFVTAVSNDLDGDGRHDLAWVIGTGASAGRLRVALSEGEDYAEPATWFEGDLGVAIDGAALLSGDFNADGRVDLAVLGSAGEPGSAALRVLRNRAGTSLGSPRTWWSGELALEGATAWSGDVSGDGRADLIVRQDLASGGIRLSTALAVRPPPGLGPLKERFRDTSLRSGRTLAVTGDANRDGREDVYLVIGGDGRTRIDRLKGTGNGGLSRITLWKAPANDPLRVGRTRVAVADVDYDGRSDVVLFRREDDGTTTIGVLKARYDGLVKGPLLGETPDDLGLIEPF